MPARNLDDVFMDIARTISTCSYDDKLKVGSVIVKDGNILACGYNGTPSGFDNTTRNNEGMTHPWVVHSEANAITKLAKNGGSSQGATIFCTHSPCYECAKLIIQSGITEVVYSEVYDENSIDFLEKMNITLRKEK